MRTLIIINAYVKWNQPHSFQLKDTPEERVSVGNRAVNFDCFL